MFAVVSFIDLEQQYNHHDRHYNGDTNNHVGNKSFSNHLCISPSESKNRSNLTIGLGLSGKQKLIVLFEGYID